MSALMRRTIVLRTRVLTMMLAIGFASWLHVHHASLRAQTTLPPEVVTVLGQSPGGSSDAETLNAGKVVVRTQVVPEALESVVTAAVKIASPLDRTVAYFHQFIAYVDGDVTMQYGNFARPAEAANVASLRIGDDDLADLRECKPQSCQIRAGAQSVEGIMQGADWRAADAASRAQPWMRTALVDLAAGYQQRGDAALKAHDDKGAVIDVQGLWQSLLSTPSAASALAPGLRDYVTAYPSAAAAEATDLLYWDKQRLTGLKPIVGVTHLVTWRDPAQPHRAIVLQKQLFASHYIYGALSVSLFVTDPNAPSPTTYLVYSNRTRGDLFRGPEGSEPRGLRARVTNFSASLQRRAGEQIVKQSAERLLGSMKQALER